MSEGVETREITTQVPARLDRLPWSRFHWLVVVGLGAVWVLDGLEVTIASVVAGVLTEPGSGLNLTPGQIGLAHLWRVSGALFFGQLTDRLGRKKLFIATLAIYLAATATSGLESRRLS